MDLPRTLLHALHDRASKFPDRPALWTKRHGYYLPLSWRDYEARVKQLALGFLELGLRPGGAVAILGFNREEWVVSALAAMAVGGVPAGVYITSSPEQIQYIVGHCEAELLVVEDERLLERVLEVRDRLPRLRHVIVMEAPQPLPHGVLSYQDVLARGFGKDEGPYWNRFHALEPEQLATLIYTSGTTGNPKGVMLSHRNLTWTARQLCVSLGVRDDEVLLSYLPLSHIAEQMATFHAALLAGFQVYFAESLERMPRNLTEVRPTIFFGVPRIWEKFRDKAERGLRDLSPRRAQMMAWARKVSADVVTRQLSHERVPAPLQAQYELARRMVLQPLKEKMGLERTRLFLSAAAAIGRDVLDFFLSVDIVIREIYGQSEDCGPTSVSTEEATRPGALGKPMLGVEVRIADDGEILVRGGNVCMGYNHDREATAELLEGGWMHSGDLGEIDGEGYLRITGRKKEIIVTSGGKKTPPAGIEALLKAIPPLGNPVVVGDGRNYLAALLPLDPERVAALAKERGWPADPAALAQDPAFRAYLDEQLDAQVNRKLSRFEAIKRYRVLPHDLTVEAGELTPTLKVRRKIVTEKYRDLIEAMYGGGGGEKARDD